MLTAPSCHALYCCEHGITFVTEEYYNQETTICPQPGCKRPADHEATLFKAAKVDGCAFCKKVPMVGKFLYDERTGKVFCHPHCYKCFRKDCLMKNCLSPAKFTMYLVINNQEEYVVPVCYCAFHSKKLPTRPDENIWHYICGMMKSRDRPIPNREDCILEMRELV